MGFWSSVAFGRKRGAFTVTVQVLLFALLWLSFAQMNPRACLVLSGERGSASEVVYTAFVGHTVHHRTTP